MKIEGIKAAIKELEGVEREQLNELEETRAILSRLKKLVGGRTGIVITPPPSTVSFSAKDPTVVIKETYAEISISLLKQAGRPMHINEIVEGIHRAKSLPRGSVARTSLQTSLMRYIDKGSGEIRKVGPGIFEFCEKVKK